MHTSVASRLDDLPPRLQLTLKVASVLGTHIPLALLAAVHPDTPPLEVLAGDMAQLCAADFVCASQPPGGAWRWCQELTRAAVYALLPVATQRQGLHRAVAHALAGGSEGGDMGLEEQLAVAHHWQQACAGNEAAAAADVQQVGGCVYDGSRA